jgi:hypothetical protein
LVPGAWLGAWCWKQAAPALEKAGHAAYPVTLTGMGGRVLEAGHWPMITKPAELAKDLMVLAR